MPLLRLETSAPVPEAKKDALLKACSALVASVTGKPESYVMVTLLPCSGSIGGNPGAMAYLDIRGIGGLDKGTNGRLAKELAALLNKELGLASENIYLTFTDVPAANWGWKGHTFG